MITKATRLAFMLCTEFVHGTEACLRIWRPTSGSPSLPGTCAGRVTYLYLHFTWNSGQLYDVKGFQGVTPVDLKMVSNDSKKLSPVYFSGANRQQAGLFEYQKSLQVPDTTTYSQPHYFTP
jgi:hypothetical protein